jgi:hypothetical protein
MIGSYTTILRQVKASYRGSAKQAWISKSESPLQRHFLKPASLYLTPLFVWLRLSPNQVTWIGFCVGVAACALLAFGVPPFVVAGAWLYLVHRLLDHVDGNLARYGRTSSYYGHYLDGSLGIVVQMAFYFGLGIGAYRQCRAGAGWGAAALSGHPEVLLLAGGLVSSLWLLTRYTKLDYRWTLANASRASSGGAAARRAPEDRRERGGAEACSAERAEVRGGGRAAARGPGRAEARRGGEARARWRRARRARGAVPLIRVAGLLLAVHTGTLLVYFGFFAVYVPVGFAVQYARLLRLGRRTLRAGEPRMDLIQQRIFEIV